MKKKIEQARCECYTGDWNHILANHPRETCKRCKGWRPKF